VLAIVTVGAWQALERTRWRDHDASPPSIVQIAQTPRQKKARRHALEAPMKEHPP